MFARDRIAVVEEKEQDELKGMKAVSRIIICRKGDILCSHKTSAATASTIIRL